MIGKNKEWPLARIIIPASKRINIYSETLNKTTSLAAVMVATIINKIWGWRVEVIDENNYRGGPVGKDDLPDHVALQRENPAALVGFYCGLSSTISRVWDLAAFYKSKGVFAIAGSWHAHYLPEETLKHNIDLVVHGDGEPVIGKIILNINNGLRLWVLVPGVSFLRDGKVLHNSLTLQEISDIPDKDEVLGELMNQVSNLSSLPYPDFGLVKYAKIKLYPIGRIRGCSKKCEFCSVRGAGRWASPEHLFKTVDWLVQTRRAKEFFVVDDRLEEDIEGTIRFFALVEKNYGNRLRFTVQMRLEAAENILLLETLYNAGVRIVCIGYESPIKEELKAMRKGLASSRMLELTKIWRKYFRVHGMFIVGYPLQNNQPSSPVRETRKAYKSFIQKARLDSVQILIVGPVPGSDFERRMRAEKRLIFTDEKMWLWADGNFVLFRPIGMTVKELQGLSMGLMRWFYGPMGFPKIVFRTLTFPFDWLIRGWHNWYEDWCRDKIRFFGRYLVRRWQTTRENVEFLKKIEEEK